MNDRLEIASRIAAGWMADTRDNSPIDVIRKASLQEADALIAEEARTRRAEAGERPYAWGPAAGELPLAHSLRLGKEPVQVGGKTHFVHVEVADELDKLREVAEDMYAALVAEDAMSDETVSHKECEAVLHGLCWDETIDSTDFVVNLRKLALAAARDLGLGGVA